MSFWLLAPGIIAGAIWVALAVRGLMHPMHRRGYRTHKPSAADRPHAAVAHYRASGALPRWEP